MPQFGEKSARALATCHPDLIRLFTEVVKRYDCAVLEGHRNEADQNKAFDDGLSEKQWPDGKHNKLPSDALDASPYPIDWKDKERFYHFAGYVLGVADQLGITIRWGGDWDRDKDFKDQRFQDLVHFERVPPILEMPERP